MGDDEKVLARWSRLKHERAARDGKKQATEDPEASRPPQPDPTHAPTFAAFDISTLPPLESIVAGSDVRAFLQAGVPAALTRAALRRAWSSDPAIRDFIETAENQWDFANPDTIPGFGSLTAADDIPQLVAKALGEWSEDQQAITKVYDASTAPHPSETDLESTTTAGRGSGRDHDGATLELDGTASSDPEIARAPQQNEGAAPVPPRTGPRRRRGHGGALPS